jgi:hypothetical protein
VNDGARDPQPLLHAARESGNHRVSLYLKANFANHFAHPLRDVAFGHSVGVSKVVQIFPDLQVIVNGKEI